jgi:hypothetical protein
MFRFFEKCHIFSVYVNLYSVKYVRFFDSIAVDVCCVPPGGNFLAPARKSPKNRHRGGFEWIAPAIQATSPMYLSRRALSFVRLRILFSIGDIALKIDNPSEQQGNRRFLLHFRRCGRGDTQGGRLGSQRPLGTPSLLPFLGGTRKEGRRQGTQITITALV